MNKTGYYYENNHIYRYFCALCGRYFKTEEEYLSYIKENNISVITGKILKRAKYAWSTEGIKCGKVIDYEYFAPGLQIFDNRDFSMYYFDTEEAAQEFIDYYKKDPDCYLQQCYYDGSEGDEVYDVEYIADKFLEDIKIIPFNPEKENKKFCHLILSYLPSDEKRELRYNAHVKQIKNIKAITPHTRIYIVAQNYKEEEYINDPQITYLSKYDQGIGAQQARNELLAFLYNSDYEYGIMSDDDALLVPTQSVINFYRDVEERTDEFIANHIDICYARNMQYEPLREGDIFNRENTNKNWAFYYKQSYWLNWVLIRNFKKAYGEEEYQDVNIDPTVLGGYDDIDFSLTLAAKGYHTYMMPLLQLI